MRRVGIHGQRLERIPLAAVIFYDIRQRFHGRSFRIGIMHQDIDVLGAAGGCIIYKRFDRHVIAAGVRESQFQSKYWYPFS